MDNPIPKKRIRRVYSNKCANPLFMKWLLEWRVEADAKGSKMGYVYSKAITSLKKYPMPLKSGREAKILENFGDKICKMLDDRMVAYSAENEESNNGDEPVDDEGESSVEPTQEARPSESLPQHHVLKPEPRLGGLFEFWYISDSGSEVRSKDEAAVIVDDDVGVGFKIKCRQIELSKLKQKFKLANPDTSTSVVNNVIAFITDPDAPEYCNPPADPIATVTMTTTSTALTSSAQSKPEERQIKPGRKPKKETKLREIPAPDVQAAPYNSDYDSQVSGRSDSQDLNSQESNPSSATLSEPVTDLSQHVSFSLFPDQYDIVLCVDSMETTGGVSGSKKEMLIPELERSACPFEVRRLHVGDFVWLAIPKSGVGGRDLVLDFVVERKRIDDLCNSITDGRFREQKFRLKQCGLRKPIYLVENYGKAVQNLRMPEQTLTQALINTQVVDRLIVKKTPNLTSSVKYLTAMTHYLIQSYRTKTLHCCSGEVLMKSDNVFDMSSQMMYLMSFTDFNKFSMKQKTMSINDMWAKHLMQIKGMSAGKASKIVDIYKTPKSLLEAYDRCSNKVEKEKLLAWLKCGSMNRNIGPALGKAVSIVYAE